MDTLHLHTPKPKMIAHRGLSGLEMENTNSAFVAAGNRSYYGIETDVHRTADGHFIIIHDDNARRVTGDNIVIEDSTFETLRSLHLLDKDGKRGRKDLILPSLQEYIQICKKYEKISVLELKNHFVPDDLQKIIEIIENEGWLDHTIFISFDLPNMINMRKKLPHQKLQYLLEAFTPDLIQILLENQLDLDIYYQALTRDNVEMLHAAGIEINVWTVDRPEDAARLAEYGVDYITSNIIE